MSSLTAPGPTAVFHVVELQVDVPASGAASSPAGRGTRPRGALTQLTAVVASTETVRFSDHGYVSDAHVPYPPLVVDAFAIDRRLDLAPGQASSAETFGSIALNNPDGALSGMITGRVVDHLPVRILAGRKTLDATRMILTDPTYANLVQVFGGLARSWQPDLLTVSVGLLDPTYWLSATMPTGTYGGSGGLDGDSNVSGRAMPRLRGPVSNVTAVLIDAVNFVYHLSDGPASIAALYEGGYAGGIASAGTVADIYAASTAPGPGKYTVQSGASGTWFRLGTRPVYAITVDATGSFRSGAAASFVLDIVRQMLIEDLALPSAYLDPSWAASATPFYHGGWFWDGSSSVTGQDVIETLLAGLGVRIIPTRTGTLRPLQLAVPPPYATPRIVLTPDNMSSIAAVALPDVLDPPAYRWRIGWGHNFTVQAAGSGLHPQAPAVRLSFAVLADRTASWFSAAIKSRYRVPNDPDLITTALQLQGDASAVAALHGALWGGGRRVWACTVPKTIAYGCDLGDPVSITFPVPGLTAGAIGVVVGEQVRSSDATSVLQILV